MRVLVVLGLIFGLLGCTPAESGSPGRTSAIPQDEATCKAAGATWRPVCLMGKPACVVAYADADKTCRDGDECLGGQCRVAGTKMPPDGTPATGKCVASSDPCGCFALVEDGKVTAALCVD
jgi:hypothetical protein